MFDLNAIMPKSSGELYPDYERSTRLHVDGVTLDLYFDDLERYLLEHIRHAAAIVGCVAWLTSVPILKALQKKQFVSLIVQKEDFLRPDLDVTDVDQWKQQLRELYTGLKCDLSSLDMPGIIPFLVQENGEPAQMSPVRCVGSINRAKRPAVPKMHHKFLVFCELAAETNETSGDISRTPVPYAVWTGSFNFTKAATKSLDNALVLYDAHLARAFYNEYAHVFAISEPLDWETDWIHPEYRIP